MSTVIQIKRSDGSTAPATTDLVSGELAYAKDKSNDGASAILYIESEDSSSNQVIHKIGGKYYTDLVDAATNANTASAIVKRDGSGNFSAGTITADLTGDVTGDVTGNADTASAWATARTITLAGDLSGSVSLDGSADVTLTATVGSNNIALGTDTTGNYVATIADAGSGNITVSGSGSETAAVTLDLSDSGVSSGSYGSTTAVPVLTVDAKGRITAATTAAIATSFDIAADSGTNDTVAGGETLTFSGTSNEIETTVSGNEITIGLPNDVTIGNDLTISGNLTVSGTSTTVNTQTLSVEDPLIALATGNNSTDAVDIGIFGLYDTSGSQDLYSGFFRDAGDGKWKLFKDSQTAPTTTVDTGATGYAVADLVANVEGNVTGGTVSGLSAAIAVGDGGTGNTSITSNGIVYGNGTGALQATAAGTDGYFLYSNSGTPDWTNTIDGGSF
jgi:hypothetical protein